ncbi:MAG TPA: FkbM family methyltransferase, partial [Polyangiaceae bacterium]
MGNLDRLFAGLADDASRQLLVRLLAFRTLGNERVRLPLAEDHDYIRRVRELEKLATGNETIAVNFKGITLRQFDLSPVGYPLRLFGTAAGLVNTFILRQYLYAPRTPPLKVEHGDVVIDAGGCWGDTALYFGHESRGRVLVFEFIPSNIEVLRRNLALNPGLAGSVEVIPHPVWSTSEVPVYCRDNGPGSRVSFDRLEANDQVVRTRSIDDVVTERNLPRVDFIKMDIEGAELEALAGARTTIRRWRPKLAISVYHRPTDISAIPEYIE